VLSFDGRREGFRTGLSLSAAALTAVLPERMADPSPSPSRRQRLRRFFLEFGALGLAVHYAIYGLVLIGFALSIGLLSNGHGGTLGVWAAAYVAAKLTMPLRALGTVALTPLLRALLRRLRKPVGPLPVVVEAARRHESR
jgi:hypothetical protein